MTSTQEALPGISPIQSAMLRTKVAAFVKEANPGMLRNALGGFFRSGLFTRAGQNAAGQATRVWSPMRTAATGVGTAYGVGLAGHHMGIPGMSADPTRGMNTEQQFRHHMGEFNQQASPIMGQLESAIAKGDWNKANELQGQLERGDFGNSGGGWLGRTFMPWMFAGQGNAAYHRDRAMGAQSQLQTQYDTAMRQHIGTPQEMQAQMTQLQQRMNNPQLMPQQRRMMEMQLAQMRQRFAGNIPAESNDAAAIATRMRNAGMTVRPFGQNAGQPGGLPGPQLPGVYQGSSPWGMSPTSGPMTVPNPATMGMNAGISPSMTNTNPWALNNAVQRWALNPQHDFQARPRV